MPAREMQKLQPLPLQQNQTTKKTIPKTTKKNHHQNPHQQTPPNDLSPMSINNTLSVKFYNGTVMADQLPSNTLRTKAQ